MPRWDEVGGSHGVKREVPAATLQHPEAQKNGDCADVRYQQVEKSGTADLWKPVLSRDQEVGRDCHRLPRHHERVGIIG